MAEEQVQGVQAECNDVEEGASKHVPKEGFQLSEHQKALRWKNHIAAHCIYMIVMFYFGASPLVDAMNTKSSQMSAWLAPGITSFVTLTFCSMLVIMPSVGSVWKLLKYNGILIWLVLLLGAAFPLSIGLAASTEHVWIPYLGAVLASPAFAVAVESGKVMVVQWWAVDSNQRFGVALFGFGSGIGLLMMTFGLGYTCHYWGLAFAAYAQASLFVIASFWPLFLALRGELGPPPADLGSKRSTSSSEPRKQAVPFSFHQICFHSLATVLPACGMKMLLTSIFQDSYALSFLSSSKLAALTLVLYAVSRSILAYVAKPGRVMHMQTAMILITGVLYSCYPTIIQELPVWCLAVAKAISGGCFSGILSLQPLLLLEIYEPQDLPAVFMKVEACAGIGWTLGPAVGYYLTLMQKSRGVSEQHAFDLFFYVSAVIYLSAAANMVVLHVRQSACRSQRAQDAA